MGDAKSRVKKFFYKTGVTWQGEKKGVLSSLDKPDIEIATPPEFKGHPGIWTPEDLFVSSVNSCIMTTFLYYAEREAIQLLSYKSKAEGVLEMTDGRLVFSGIKIMPQISVKSPDDMEKVNSLINLSEKNCLISNSIKSRVEVIPEIKVEK